MKKWPAILIGAVDAVLLTVILISATTGWRIGAPKSQPSDSDAQLTLHDTESNVSGSIAVRQTEAADSDSYTEATQRATEKATEQPETEAPKASYPASDEVSTNEGPTLSDIQGFMWNKDKGAYWSILTSSAAKLTDFDAVKGGWKAYLLDDPSGKRTENSVERFANISLSGSASVAKANIDWIYATAGDEGDGYEDSAPDSTFNGAWSDGAFSGLGSGKLTLYHFYFESGREYGVGSYTWPDGVESIIALVRP